MRTIENAGTGKLVIITIKIFTATHGITSSLAKRQMGICRVWRQHGDAIKKMPTLGNASMESAKWPGSRHPAVAMTATSHAELRKNVQKMEPGFTTAPQQMAPILPDLAAPIMVSCTKKRQRAHRG
jgi:hypothetical protein